MRIIHNQYLSTKDRPESYRTLQSTSRDEVEKARSCVAVQSRTVTHQALPTNRLFFECCSSMTECVSKW